MSKPQPFQAERQILRRVKHDAKRGGREFDVSIDTFAKLIHLPCYYCGSQDMNAAIVKMTDENFKPYTMILRYNGIDRIDNSIGYVDDNCVPCCFICNRAKRELSFEDFTDWIVRLVNKYSEENK